MTTPPNSSNAPDLPGIPGHSTAERRAILAGLGGLAAGAFLAGRAQAGPLNPPAGPVASTGKTLTDVEPRIAINATNTPGDAASAFRISQPGSYYLTRNVLGEAGKSGIDVTANGVTIDLNGFELAGVNGSLDAIRSSIVGGVKNLAVFNGSVRNWGGTGVNLFNCNSARVERVRAIENGAFGIRVALAGTIINCSVTNNTSGGLFASDCSLVANCCASFNLADGIIAASNCAIVNCSANLNTGDGIDAESNCTISDCVAASNGALGITTASSCRISGCAATGNQLFGISVTTSSVVTGCTAASNGSHGISLSSNNMITGNVCAANGVSTTGSGIRAASSDNRIEGNNCVDNDVGIECVSAGNFIVRNTCSGNTTLNWSLVANNVHGPIVDRTAPASAAVSGNSAPDSTASTHPNANFTY